MKDHTILKVYTMSRAILLGHISVNSVVWMLLWIFAKERPKPVSSSATVIRCAKPKSVEISICPLQERVDGRTEASR